MIGSALEETDRLSKIVDQLLSISRLDAGEACREVVRLDLGNLATSTADQLRLLADEKSISLVFNVTPNVFVEADQIRLRQVIANLLDNAIKYTHPGGMVEVSVSSSENVAVLQVQDNGVGIAPAALLGSRAVSLFGRFRLGPRHRQSDLCGAQRGRNSVQHGRSGKLLPR
jgi:signal transduction histidine kinase